MLFRKKDKYGLPYYTFKDLMRLHRINTFFVYGFYVALIIWICGMCFVMFSEASAGIKIAVDVGTFLVYLFFTVGKAIIRENFRK